MREKVRDGLERVGESGHFSLGIESTMTRTIIQNSTKAATSSVPRKGENFNRDSTANNAQREVKQIERARGFTSHTPLRLCDTRRNGHTAKRLQPRLDSSTQSTPLLL